jgi:peptidyl-prolyl cis-trans isomerase SurA
MARCCILLICLTLAVIDIAPAQEAVENIVAIVGREPILTSELAAQIQLLAIQRGIRPKDQEELRQFQEQVLQDLIADRLLLIEARKDTSIKVSDQQVDDAVDDHISNLISQFPSEDVFLQELAREGLTLRAFKKRLRPEMENQLLRQSIINRKLTSISISNQEVAEFYKLNRDSIPIQPEAVRLAHILVTFQPSGATEDSARLLAEKVRQNAAAGADFAVLAATYSSGPGALTGGDLGLVARDDVIPDFGRVAFNLQPNEISGVFRTEYGYHIVKCEENRGDKSRLRQILFEVKPTAADSLLSYKLVDSLLLEIEKGTGFAELAKIFSADDESRKQGGELGWFAMANLPPTFAEAVENMTDTGQVKGPVASEYGLHILKLLEHQESRPITFESDFDRIKGMARQAKTGEIVAAWLEELKKGTYVEIRGLPGN